MDRRALLAAGLALPAIGAAAAAPAGPGVEEWTFLRSTDSDPAALLRFLEGNWLAMDRQAIAAGLFAEARLMVAEPAEATDWNVVMIVRYVTTAGYEGVKAPFDAIRARHTPVRPDGKSLAELGQIVGTRRLALAARA